ncbi:MAG TPA: radical SAM protein [Desulfomicrobiaceae bacterium]|nr:radical SAM protein [Desulfomicrobiaceae bacterium]
MTTPHPCFDTEIRKSTGRLHLPVAGETNARNKFDDEQYLSALDCKVTAAPTTISPADALAFVGATIDRGVAVDVVGITGPGDPFASPEATLRTLELVREKYPDMTLCVTTNGLGLPEHVARLAAAQVNHVTLLIHSFDPGTVQQIYAWIRPGKRTMAIARASELLIAEQKEAIRRLVAAGITVKVNTVVYPGINDEHISEIAAEAAASGATVMHLSGFAPAPESETPLSAASSEMPASARAAAAEHLTVMDGPEPCGSMIIGTGCTSCGTEAGPVPAGLPLPGGDRPLIAVASSDGYDINEHLGQARKLLIYGPKDGPISLLETRPTPLPGTGSSRWETLGKMLSDCTYLLVSGLGDTPKKILEESGLRVIVSDENVEGMVDALYGGGKKGKCKKK